MCDSFVIAFSTYSRIPMPRVEWGERAMKFAICFFPLVGAAVGGCALLWVWLCGALGLTGLLPAAGLTALPLLLTGGIHMDGFCDTVDALSSHQTRERMLEILKDSHCGAFAVIFAGVWLLLYTAAVQSVASLREAGILALGFVLSRALSGLALTNWKGARPSGMLQAFADASHRKAVTITMVVFLVLSAAGMLLLSPIRGGVALIAAGLAFLHYRHISYSRFGGITGDLAGYFVQLCELAVALALAFTAPLV